jgi:hypothetical protein
MMLILAAIKGPVEEFGWRGLALPLLQRKFAPFWAGLILGVLWGLWHLPAFLLSGTQQSDWPFRAFFAGCLAISVIATALFNSSQGSILLSAFFHFSLMNPVFPDAQPYDTYLLIVAAALIVWWNRQDMFSKEGSVTEVIPDSRDAIHFLTDVIDEAPGDVLDQDHERKYFAECAQVFVRERDPKPVVVECSRILGRMEEGTEQARRLLRS